MHHRVDLRGPDHLGDDRVADVGPDELGAAQVRARRQDVDADHAVHVGGVVELPDQGAAEMTGDARHQYDSPHAGPRPSQ